MANWNNPLTTSTYANFVTEVKDRDLDVAKGLDPAFVTVTNPVANMIRWTSASDKWEKYSGTAWGDLSALYAINISGTASNITGTLLATKGGTGQTTYAVGDILFASTTTALSKLASVAAGNALISGGVNTAPYWGTLPIGGGGTGATTATAGLANLGGLPLAGGTMTGMITAHPSVGVIGNATFGARGIEVKGAGAAGDAAFMVFHRLGVHAAAIGIDTDNEWKVGGWSMGANAYKLWHAGNTVPAANGGTGQASYAVGDLLYASTTTALSKLASVAAGNALISGGVGVAPSWGVLPISGGGTGQTTAALAKAALGVIGAGQTWQDVKASRALASTYTNSTGRTIVVAVVVQTAVVYDFSATVNSGTVGFSSAPGGYNSTLLAIVPDGATYSFNTSSAGTIQHWRELRT